MDQGEAAWNTMPVPFNIRALLSKYMSGTLEQGVAGNIRPDGLRPWATATPPGAAPQTPAAFGGTLTMQKGNMAESLDWPHTLAVTGMT